MKYAKELKKFIGDYVKYDEWGWAPYLDNKKQFKKD